MNNDKLEFASRCGFKSVSEAMFIIGAFQFEKEYVNYRHGENITESRLVYFNNNYIIYNDGRCYSMLSNKFLAQIKVVDRKHDNREYLTYNIRHKDNPKKKHTIAKLVYYHFGLHDFKSYDEMVGSVIHIDGDLCNNHIDNLMWMGASRKNKHYKVTVKPDIYRFKIPKSDIDKVLSLRREGYTLKTYCKII